ncbi:MAG TPA: TolC family protein, partial [Cytophagaceae bacterium]|nr:TolC family protein [Cytophagaceae bacterium]
MGGINIFIILFLLTFSAGAQDTLTLEQAIELGLKNNYSIIISKNAEHIAKNNNSIGVAGFLPQVNASFNDAYNKQNTKAISAVTGQEKVGTGVKSNIITANALVNWTIFNGFNAYINKSRLQELQSAGESQARMNIENTVDQIIVTYFAIVQQQKMIVVIQEAINLSLQRLKLAEAMKSIGTGSDQAILQATVDANADSARLVQQISNVVNSKADLNRLLARDPGTLFEVKNNIEINTSLTFPDLQEKLDKQNAQLLVSRANVNVARYTIDNIKTQYSPLINLFGGYNYSKNVTPFGAQLFNQSNGLTYGLTASWNIFNGGITTTNLQNSKILLQSGQMQYEDTKLSLHNDLYKFFNNYRTSMQLIKIQTNNVTSARKDVDIAMGRYRLGNINDIDLR